MIIRKIAGKLGKSVEYFQRAFVYNIMNHALRYERRQKRGGLNLITRVETVPEI